MTLDYVASGCSFARMINKRDGFKQIIVDELKHLNTTKDYKVSLLFNALTESGHGDVFQDYRKESDIYVDSGGLQLGIYGEAKYGNVTDKKKEVYKTQATYGDYAFIFDDIPIIDTNTAGNSTKVNFNSRYFTKTRMQEAAYNTAMNVKEQIEVIKRLNSKTKVFLISHGNTPETYAEYTERIFDHLTLDESEYIYGLAPSSAANGSGSLERFDMIYGIKGYNIPDHIKKHIHFLGLGSPNALLPFIASPDYFNFIEKLSFDSTSHTRKYAFSGEICNWDGKPAVLKKHLPVDNAIPYFERVFEKYKHYFQRVGIETCRELVEGCTHYSPYNTKKQWEFGRDEEKYKIGQSLIPALTTFDWIEYFFKQLEDLKTQYLPKMTKMNEVINTVEDYTNHRTQLRDFFKLTSNKVRSDEEISNTDEWNEPNMFGQNKVEEFIEDDAVESLELKLQETEEIEQEEDIDSVLNDIFDDKL